MTSWVGPIAVDPFNAVHSLTDLRVSGAREPEIKNNESGGKGAHVEIRPESIVAGTHLNCEDLH